MMKKFLICLLLINLQLISGQNTQFEKSNSRFKNSGIIIKNSFNSISGDFKYMGKSFSDDWKTTSLYAAGVLGLILVDKTTTSFLHNQIEPNIQYQLPDISFVKRSTATTWLTHNDAYMSYPIIGLYLGSVLGNSEKGQYAAINAFKAIAYSTLISQLVLKTIFGRQRPFRPIDSSEEATPPWTKDNFDFFNSREGTYLGSGPYGSSFPSLHATAFFAIAKVFQMEYDNYWIPYGFMSVVFLADIKGHNHWVSDLVVGGIIGTIIGRSIVKSSWETRNNDGLKKKKGITFNVIPKINSEWSGLHIIGTF